MFKPDLHPHGQTIEFKFILARPPDDDWRFELDKEKYVVRRISWQQLHLTDA